MSERARQTGSVRDHESGLAVSDRALLVAPPPDRTGEQPIWLVAAVGVGCSTVLTLLIALSLGAIAAAIALKLALVVAMSGWLISYRKTRALQTRSDELANGLQSIVAAVPGTMLVTGPRGRIQVLRRGREAQFLGLDSENCMGQPLANFVPREIFEAFSACSKDAAGNTNQQDVALPCPFDSAKQFWVRLRVTASDSGGFICFLTDTTARREAEAKVERLNGQLSDASRRAGAAEFAADMLHDIGNTLNQAKVSTGLAQDRVHGLSFERLARITAALADSDAMLLKQPEAVAEYLRAIHGSLSAERRQVTDQLQEVQESLKRVGQAINRQQELAKPQAAISLTNMETLVDDALTLCAVDSRSGKIEIKKRVRIVDRIWIDRQKVLHIVENLVRNAIAAAAHGSEERHRVSLRVDQLGQSLVIDVIDNGLGIAPERLAAIFSPREDLSSGRKWGLHESANAAAELGGRLTCISAGRDLGAVFTLEIPLVVPSATAIEESAPPLAAAG